MEDSADQDERPSLSPFFAAVAAAIADVSAGEPQLEDEEFMMALTLQFMDSDSESALEEGGADAEDDTDDESTDDEPMSGQLDTSGTTTPNTTTGDTPESPETPETPETPAIELQTIDSSGMYTPPPSVLGQFHPGSSIVRRVRQRGRGRPLQQLPPHQPISVRQLLAQLTSDTESKEPETDPEIETETETSRIFTQPWAERILTPPTIGAIRLLTAPPPDTNPLIERLWYTDKTYTEWMTLIQSIQTDISNQSLAAVLYPPDYLTTVTTIWTTNQRTRWIAKTFMNRWRTRIWHKRPQCNIDLIEMEPVKDVDAVLLTDTPNRTVFRFHRRDIFKNMISKICLSDCMMPTPQAPTNPWTNQALTLAQTIAVCRSLIEDYAKRGKCPPVLFAGFCHSGYSLKRFLAENTTLLSQHAIMTHFKELNSNNQEDVAETMMQLISESGRQFSSAAIRRWIRMPPTPIHREWLSLVRDYTIYLNLHVEVRPNWRGAEAAIYADVRSLLNRTEFPDPASARMQLLRNAVHANFEPAGLPVIMNPPPPLVPSFFSPQMLINLPSPITSMLTVRTQSIPGQLQLHDQQTHGGGAQPTPSAQPQQQQQAPPLPSNVMTMDHAMWLLQNALHRM